MFEGERMSRCGWRVVVNAAASPALAWTCSLVPYRFSLRALLFQFEDHLDLADAPAWQ